MKYLVILIIFICPSLSISQLSIVGTVVNHDIKGDEVPLSDVNIHWLGSTTGTTTNSTGQFSIPFQKEYKMIVLSFVGYKSDTILVNRPNLGKIWLHSKIELDEVIVQSKTKSIHKSLFQVQNTVNVNSREMLKAACCNLSESFETNPSVDVNISDAISGAKQIQMLGLNSPYLMFTQENMPSIRGASQVYGLSFIPGSWIESIQITKGAGSVINGYESISGQINSELVKPLIDKRFFLNMYANNYERYEFNSRYNFILNDHLSSGIYVHANKRNGKIDKNSDSFLDTPLSKQINLMNRWQYIDPDSGWVSYLNLQFLTDKKQTGQINFNPDIHKNSNNIWGSEIKTDRLDLSTKLGYVFPELPYQSIGFQAAYSNHNQNSYYGLNIYDINHKSLYTNAIFNSIIGNTQHKFKTGMSFTYDFFNEYVNSTSYLRNDNSIGAFFEYTYDNLENISLVAGLRVDNHNRLNTFITPRLHLRYSLWDKASFRASAGRGKRAANIFAENQQLFASSRQINIIESNGNIYGLKPEIAWNYGCSFIQKLYLWNRVFDFSIDFYKTRFINQVIIDWENPRQISFYNLSGESFSNSLQLDLNYEILQNFDIRVTYKNYKVLTDYSNERLQKPLQPNNRFFTNLNYETPMKFNGQWRFDFTVHWQGKQRLPSTENNPLAYQLSQFSKPYSVINSQVTKVFSSNFEIYFGGENINNITQNNPILASNMPFGPNFDSTIISAPILGGTYYLGMRYKL